MRIRLFIVALCMGLAAALPAGAQGNDASELYNTGISFLRSGDYSNAILVLNRAAQLSPENAQYRKQLAYAYYLNNNFSQAEKVIREVLRSDAADVQTYQIAGNIYRSMKDLKAAERNYKRGLNQFPESGDLYNEMGQVYYDQRKVSEALRSWTKGIEVDPDYPSNYYNAARTYFYSKDKVWTVLYGEIFIALERYTTRTAEMKTMLLEAYKKLFNELAQHAAPLPGLQEQGNTKTDTPPFREAYLGALAKGSSLMTRRGVTPESLTMLRTRFILEWSNFYALVYPFALFDYQRQLLRQGLFEAYNQWLFGPAADGAAYKSWVQRHAQEMDVLVKYLNSHPLKPPTGQFYQRGKVTFEAADLPQ